MRPILEWRVLAVSHEIARQICPLLDWASSQNTASSLDTDFGPFPTFKSLNKIIWKHAHPHICTCTETHMHSQIHMQFFILKSSRLALNSWSSCLHLLQRILLACATITGLKRVLKFRQEKDRGHRQSQYLAWAKLWVLQEQQQSSRMNSSLYLWSVVLCKSSSLCPVYFSACESGWLDPPLN